MLAGQGESRLIDIHCHILPGVDDGVRTVEEAVELARMEVAGGTKAFIATPHVAEKRDYDRLGIFAETAETLREALCQAGVEVAILLGGELYPTANIATALDQGKEITLAKKGRHVLIDLPLRSFPMDFNTLMYGVQLRGVVPILAHPERTAHCQENPERIHEYLEKGMLVQINAGSLKGRYGPRAKEVAEHYLIRHLAHIVATDSHRPHRSPSLQEAQMNLEALVGREYADYLVSLGPSCVAKGIDLPERPIAPPPAERGFFAKLLRRG